MQKKKRLLIWKKRFLILSFEESQNEINFLSVALPPDSSMENFIIQISNMVTSASLNLESIVPQKKKVDNELLIDLSVSGYYENLILLIGFMEKNNRLLSVKSVNIESMKSSTEQINGYVNAKLQIGAIEVGSKDSKTPDQEKSESEL